MRNYSQTVLYPETPCEYRYNAGRCKEPEPECREKGGDEMNNAVREPGLQSQQSSSSLIVRNLQIHQEDRRVCVSRHGGC